MNSKIRIVTLVMVVVILAISAAPALAGFDAGTGVGDFQLVARYPSGVLQAEGWR
jgi:hypothetical protein